MFQKAIHPKPYANFNNIYSNGEITNSLNSSFCIHVKINCVLDSYQMRLWGCNFLILIFLSFSTLKSPYSRGSILWDQAILSLNLKLVIISSRGPEEVYKSEYLRLQWIWEVEAAIMKRIANVKFGSWKTGFYSYRKTKFNHIEFWVLPYLH